MFVNSHRLIHCIMTKAISNFDKIYNSIDLFLKKQKSNVVFSLAEPGRANYGEYSTNLAMVLAPKTDQSALEIASELKTFLEDKNLDLNKIEIKQPGFLNFYLSDKALWSTVERVLDARDNYGKGAKKHFKYNVEIISANPTGPLHIGHVRNGVIGDSLARILRYAGFDVVVEHYTNDAGNQINILALTVFIYYLKLLGINKTLPTNCYQGNFYEKPAQIILKKYGAQFKDCKISDAKIMDDKANDVFKKISREYFLNKIKHDAALLDINIEYYISEESMYANHKIDTVLKKLAEKKFTYIKDNATWIKTSLKGDSKDRVIIKSDGTYTYLLPDLTAHWDKILRTKADKMVNLWGADHHSYIQRMQYGLEFLGLPPKILAVDVISMVRLVKNGQDYKMSKRAGTAVWLTDLYESVGKDVIRYMMASKAGSTPMDLNINDLQEYSRKNPVFYVQYAASRCYSILKQANDKLENPTKVTFDNQHALTSEERYLLNKLDQFPKVVFYSAEQRAPYIICDYIYNLAHRFHVFYNKYKVLDSKHPQLSAQRIALVKAVLTVLNNGFKLIGIDSKHRM